MHCVVIAIAENRICAARTFAHEVGGVRERRLLEFLREEGGLQRQGVVAGLRLHHRHVHREAPGVRRHATWHHYVTTRARMAARAGGTAHFDMQARVPGVHSRIKESSHKARTQ